jgi:hypothetical protein
VNAWLATTTPAPARASATLLMKRELIRFPPSGTRTFLSPKWSPFVLQLGIAASANL